MGLLVGLLFGLGLFLALRSGKHAPPRSTRSRPSSRERTADLLAQAGIDGVSPNQLWGASAALGLVALVLVFATSQVPLIGLLFGLFAAAAPVVLAAPNEGEQTLADYRALGLTLNRHPLALLRKQLAEFRIEPASTLRTFPNGRLARASGLVTHRQRPETAKGTVFVTLEDETGAVNVIVWAKIADAQRKPLLGATLLTVYGQWQKQGEGDEAVMHLLAAKMIDHTPLLHGLVSRSRDFR